MATGARVFESFAESLSHFKVTSGAKAYLEAHKNRLETIVNGVLAKEGKASPAEREELQSIYTGYAQRAASDRRGLVRAGQPTKTADEIRSDFFNIALGHVGGKETDRIALRAALIRDAKEVAGDVTLANGVKVPAAEVASLKMQKEMKFEMSFRDKGRLDAVLAAEAEAERAAHAAATTRATRRELRDSGLANGRQAAADAGRALFKQDAELRHSTSRLEIVYRTNGTINTDEAFSALRSQLSADPAKLLLVKELNRPNMLAPKDILKSIENGRPITEREFTDLQTFFHNYDPSVKRGAAPAIPSSTSPMVSGTATGMAMNFGRDLINMATREGNSTAIPLRLRTLFETGSEPNLFRRTVAGIGETPIIRRALLGTTLAVGLGVPAMHMTSNYLDPSDYGPVGTSAFTLLHQNWMSPSELKKIDHVTEVTSNLYFRMVTNGGFGNPMFIQYTKDLTKVDLLIAEKGVKGKDTVDAEGYKLDENGKKIFALDPAFKAGSDQVLQGLLKIANKLPSDVAEGYNADAVEAYKYALAKFSGMKIEDYKGNQSITEHLTKRISENTASRMTTNAELRDEKLKEFYGKTNLSQTELVRQFVDSENQDPLLRGIIGSYLVLQGTLKPEDLTVLGLKTKKAEITAQDAALSEKSKDALNKGLELGQTDMLAKWGAQSAESADAQPQAKKDATKTPRLSEAFNTARVLFQDITKDDAYGIKGKEKVIDDSWAAAVRQNALDMGEFEKQLKTRGINESAIPVIVDYAKMSLQP